MTKRLSTIIIIAMTMMSVVGCGKGKISNDIISIEGYKRLEISASSKEEEADAIWESLLERCEVKAFPEEALAERISELETQYSYTGYYEGKTGAEQIEDIHGITSEELAKKQLTKEYAIQAVAEKEDLELSNEEYQSLLESRAADSGLESAESYESLFGREKLEQRFLEERVLEFLLKHTK